MARYTFQIYGESENFIGKIPKKKKSLVINALLNKAIQSKLKNEVLTLFFTDLEIKEIFGDKNSSAKRVIKNNGEKNDVEIDLDNENSIESKKDQEKNIEEPKKEKSGFGINI